MAALESLGGLVSAETSQSPLQEKADEEEDQNARMEKMTRARFDEQDFRSPLWLKRLGRLGRRTCLHLLGTRQTGIRNSVSNNGLGRKRQGACAHAASRLMSWGLGSTTLGSLSNFHQKGGEQRL